MTSDLNDKNASLREKINQLVDSHPELETVVRDMPSRSRKMRLPHRYRPICRSARGPSSRLARTLNTVSSELPKRRRPRGDRRWFVKIKLLEPRAQAPESLAS